MKNVLFVFILALLLNYVVAKKVGLCTCFRPAYDGNCCTAAGGSWDPNVCTTTDYGKSVEKFRACCKEISGSVKCKPGIRY